MFLTHLIINNYKSFPPKDTSIYFNSAKSVIIGKNNAGKTNIISAIEFLLGNKDPRYVGIAKEHYYDTTKPIRISAFLSFQEGVEIYRLDIPKNIKLFFTKNLKMVGQL